MLIKNNVHVFDFDISMSMVWISFLNRHDPFMTQNVLKGMLKRRKRKHPKCIYGHAGA